MTGMSPRGKSREGPDHRLLTRAEVAKIFQVAPSTITRWAQAGKLPVVKTLGGHRRYEVRVVMELVRRLIQEEAIEKETWFLEETGFLQRRLIQEEATMENVVINVPTMYGDHHVLEVRRILLALSGVETVNASSCFQTVEVVYDPTRLSQDEIKTRLEAAGYLGELPVPTETGVAVTQQARRNGETFFRHTTAYAQAKAVISFAQEVSCAGRPLWPCPGLGVIKHAEPGVEDSVREVSHA
jgi:excisionase family DNA binding protein